ncbi:hypothetical protein AYO44_00735 [Planctomycetaceae bacterium SCGC AG-212-F19]|nr:hypothetical protein AYO44_00735 [Planctomycetaceae bacterium SCGC AG-212-F19]
MSRHPLPACVLALAVLLLLIDDAAAQVPLHQRIDEAIAAGLPNFAELAAPLADDAEFLRRIYLDLTGTIPTAADVRSFLADNDAAKREKLIDKVLASPEHARHLAHVFDVMLMERRPDKHVTKPLWHEYLRSSFAANKPWDQLVREIVSADGADAALRPAAKFYLDRLGEPHLLTRDVSRLFLGMNLQCAQCHDHPLIPHYKQDDYYGLFAFLNRSFVFTDPKTKQSVFAEKAEGDVTFVSVFDPGKLTKSTGPRMPKLTPIKEPDVEKGKEYDVAPAKDVRPIPKYSRRAQLAVHMTAAENVQFNRNAANRLWALMMGRGLVDPVDRDHPSNPPSHPQLLDMLGEEFAAGKFDVRAFLRELALSKTYQRSSLPPAGKEVPADSFAVALLKPLAPEQFAWALMQATGFSDAERLVLAKNLTEPALYAKQAAAAGPVIGMFAAPAGQAEGFQPTLDQALFLANGNAIRGWLAPRPGNLAERLAKLTDANEFADELWLSVLTRKPTDEERRGLAEYLSKRPADRAAAIQDLIWSLVASAEFRFNH